MAAQANKKSKNKSVLTDLKKLIPAVNYNNFYPVSRKKVSKKEKEYINSYVNDVILTLRAYHSVLDNYIKLNWASFFVLSCITIASAAGNNYIIWLTSFIFNVGLGISLRGLNELRTTTKQALEMARFIEMNLLPANGSYEDVFKNLTALHDKMITIKSVPLSLKYLDKIRQKQFLLETSKINEAEILTEFKKLK